MSTVIPFRDYKPSGRFDGNVWITANVQQSGVVTDTGDPTAFTTIDTFPVPDYPDPAHPPAFSVTTYKATEVPGWYRLQFVDALGGVENTSPRYYSEVNYRPRTREVAVHIKNRTVDAGNNFVGDFTDKTVVTQDEVTELIIKAEQRVLRRLDVDINEPIPTESAEAIKDLIALYAAMLVELTKFSEQVATGRSPYAQLKVLFDEQMLEIREDVLGIPAGTEPGTEPVGTMTAQYTFDDTPGINYGTEF